MSFLCPICYYQNPSGTVFCEACGHELTAPAVPDPTPIPPPDPNPSIPSPVSNSLLQNDQEVPKSLPPIPIPIPNSGLNAKLIYKQADGSKEFILDGSSAIVGRFDHDTGPVDIDLEGFPGEETVSRSHAEIYFEGTQWKVKDIGSTNGVFIKHLGQSRFGARITMPETINSGDEIAFGKIRFIFQST